METMTCLQTSATIIISGLHCTFHHFITARRIAAECLQTCHQLPCNLQSTVVIEEWPKPFGAVPRTSLQPVSTNDCQQPLSTTHQLAGEYTFPLVSGGYYRVADWSLALCDWGFGIWFHSKYQQTTCQPNREYTFFPSDRLPGGHGLVPKSV